MLERTPDQTQGVYRIDSWSATIPTASMSLREIKSEIDTVKVPATTFDKTDFPNLDTEIEGEYIPVCIGAIRGARGFLVDRSTNTFKFCDHALEAMLAFYTNEGDSFTPDTIDLANGEITYSGWDGTREIFADIVADGANPIDALKLLLTDETRGANIPLDSLDTDSTGKGFGVTGARLDYIYGTDSLTGADAITLPIGLYMDESKDVSFWTKQVAAIAFIIFYVDRTGLYQAKAWKPEVSEGLPEITLDKQTTPVAVSISATEPFTRVVARYNKNHGLDGDSITEYSDDRLRQLRGLQQHATLDKEIPISTRFGARLWAEMTVNLRGRPQRLYKIKTIQEFMTVEPGDHVRIISEELDINEVVEVLAPTSTPGDYEVIITATNQRGWKDTSGFWAPESPAFPSSLGGATITTWDDGWTDAQKTWARENLGFWTDDDGYIATDDRAETYYRSRWF